MFSTANVGTVDRVLRVVVGLVLLAAPYLFASPLWANPIVYWLALIVGLVLVLTGLFRVCPLYRLIGLNTCKTG